MLIHCVLPLVASWGLVSSGDFRPLLDAIRDVETGNHPSPAYALGDGGRSLGPYQIGWKYWRDSGTSGRYEQVRNRAYAERVMLNYWNRYCPDAVDRHDWRTLARVHNGGPDGSREWKTMIYWRKVQARLRS